MYANTAMRCPKPTAHPPAEIYRSDPPRRRECLYYLSLGHFKMGNFDEARRFNGEYRVVRPTSPRLALTPTLTLT